MVAAGLVAIGRSAYDRFRGRLLWPIRDASGDTIGFGARRIFDDDKIEAKYLNTPETPIYKKSQVLYGIDLARRDMARSSQAVVVEGYTDVMACHLSGVPTAVATCGTAFGDDHARVLRRFLHDHEEFRGEVIFTFDGDAAGQKAALRAFEGDQNFVSQTYVAVEPDGLDPCDLRIQKGDAAVRELVARRVPLYRFVLANVVGKYDLDRADGRVDAVREAARLVSSIRDKSKVDAFSRELAGHGRRGHRAGPHRGTPRRQPAGRRAPSSAVHRPPDRDQPEAPPRQQLPDLRDPRFALERETLKLVVQHPAAVGRSATDVDGNDFTHPTYRAVWELVVAQGGPIAGAGDDGWASRLRDTAPDPAVSSAISALGVEPLLTAKEPDHSLRRRARLPAPRADRPAPHRGPQVAAAAHQPGRARHRLQPDVRRAGRARAASPRTCASWRSAPREAAYADPPVAVAAGGEGAGLGDDRSRARSSSAPATRCTSGVDRRDAPRPVGAGRGRRLGPRHLRCCGSARSARGASSGWSTTSRSTSPAGCWSWSASGSPPASSCSDTSRSPAATACA